MHDCDSVIGVNSNNDGTAQSIVNEAKPRDRTGQHVVIPQRGARPQQFIIGNDGTELDLSLGSRSFLDRVNDQVRKRQTIFDECYRKRRKRFYDMGNVHVCNIGISIIHGKNYLDTRHSITNTKDLTLKQMFDISKRLVSEQDEISGLETIGWENPSWKYLSLIGDEQISLHRTSLRIFRFCIVSWKDEREPPIKHSMGRKLGVVQKFTGIHNLGQNRR